MNFNKPITYSVEANDFQAYAIIYSGHWDFRYSLSCHCVLNSCLNDDSICSLDV